MPLGPRMALSPGGGELVTQGFGFCDWAVLAQTGACAVQCECGFGGGPLLLACPWAWLVADPFWTAGQ